MNKKEIFEAFYKKDIFVKSVSGGLKVEWKKLTDITKHDVSNKNQFKISVNNNSCIATEDHSLFKIQDNKLKETKTNEFVKNSDVVCVKNDKVILSKVISNEQISKLPYMYDLSVEDNENFVLDSGFLAHNSFRPPASGKFIQGQTQVFGFIWEDEELLEYLYMAVDDFNGRPPVTGITLLDVVGNVRHWRTTIILRAAAFACFGIAMNWIADEFSLDSKELILVQDEQGNEYSLTVKELFDILYGDKIKEEDEKVKLEVLKSIEDLKNGTI